ncbi:MAG: hypothetical protein LBP58_09210, partial [Azoarcus sp.]|nr:hypothetical protein [Azoarcus sp.]
MLTIAAALMLLPASAWVTAQTPIPGVEFSQADGSPVSPPEAAKVETDTPNASGTLIGDLVGKANGIIVKGGAAAFNDIVFVPFESNGNTVDVKGEVKTHISSDEYYSIVGGATLNKVGNSGGNTVNVTATSGDTTIGVMGSGNYGDGGYKGSIIGGLTAATNGGAIATSPGYTVGDAHSNTVGLTTDSVGNHSITVGRDVFGGMSTHGNATNNTVNITGEGTGDGVIIGGKIFGGSADHDGDGPNGKGDATGNIVNISGKVNAGFGVWGGNTHHGNASDNEVKYNGVADNQIGGISGTDGGIIGGNAGIGDANDNIVGINGAGTIGYVRGGTSNGSATEEGHAHRNKATVDGTVVILNGVYGGETDQGNADGNIVTVKTGTQVFGHIIGGYVHEKGNAAKNTVSVAADALQGKSVVAGQSDQSVYGAEIEDGAATGNTVSITGAAIGTDVTYNGNGGSGTSVGGAYVWNESHEEATATLSGNGVTLTDTKLQGNSSTWGGRVDAVQSGTTITAAVTGNSVSLLGKSASPTVTGGSIQTSSSATAKGNVIGNSVSLAGESIATNVYGGYINAASGTSIEGDISDNSVSLSGEAYAATIYGGYQTGEGTLTGNVTDNTVIIETSYTGTIQRVVGGEAGNGNANANTVRITGKAGDTPVLTVTSVVGGDGQANGTATGNIVDITNATVGDGIVEIIGGYGKTEAKGNQVTIENSVVNGIVIGGKAVDGDVINNAVSFKNATIKNNVYAGQTGSNVNDKAIGNSVTIDGGKIEGTITIAGANVIATGNQGNATGNTVTLTGGITLSNNAVVTLKGVNGTFDTSADAYTGNTLEVRDFEATFNTGSKFLEISGFEKYNFYFENVDAPTGTAAAVLTADTVDLGEAAKVNL